MPPGDCFRCHQPGHWANNCPLKTPTSPNITDAVTVTSPPVIHCPCNAGVCNVLTSKTVKTPNRRFYICPSVPSCGFFKWCDQVSIKSEPVSVYPTCRCGSGPCRKVTVIDGPNAHRSYFVCSIKKSFGACGFFKWEDEAEILPESEEEMGNGGSPCSNLVQETELDCDGNVEMSGRGVVVVSGLTSTSSNEFTLGNRVVDGVAETVKDYADTLPMNEVTIGKESIPVCSSSNHSKPVSNGSVFASGDGKNRVYDDVGDVEEEEKVLPSLSPPKHLEPQVDEHQYGETEALCSDHPTNGASLEFDGKESYPLEGVTGLSQNTINPNGKIKPEHQFGETEASFSGSSSLLVDLVEQYNSEKLHFESVSMKHVDALTAFTGSYKRLETLRGRAHSLRKQLFEVETQVKLYEAESSEFAAILQEVSDEMAKSLKIMAEMARKVAKEVKVYKQSYCASL